MSNDRDSLVQTMRESQIVGLVARLDKLRALGHTVQITVQRQGGPARSFDNGAPITITVTVL